MTTYLRSLDVGGFRSLAKVSVTFGDFTVLVGPNGSGKTNLLKSLAFVRDSARFDIPQAISLAGGYDRVERQDFDSDPVTFNIVAEVTENSSSSAPDEYSLSLQKASQQGFLRSEKFRYKRVPGVGRRLTMSAKGREVRITGPEGKRTPGLALSSQDVSALGTLARVNEEVLGPGPRQFFDFLSEIRYFDPDVASARRGSRIARVSLDDSAHNLAGALWTLSQEDSDSFEELKSDLRKCLPGLRDVRLEPVGGATSSVVVRLVEAGVRAPIDLDDASFGTVRMLALLVALHEPSPPRLTIIEEVDHGLHPYALDVLVDRMRAASSRTQIIVASHSPTLVNRLNPDEVTICDRDAETGESIIPATARDEMAAAISSGDWKLGELWFSGSLAGVPR